MREKEDGPWSDAGYVSPERHSLLHQPSLKTGLPSLKPKSLFRLQEEPPPLCDVMNKFEVLGIVGEGEWLCWIFIDHVSTGRP